MDTHMWLFVLLALVMHLVVYGGITYLSFADKHRRLKPKPDADSGPAAVDRRPARTT